MRSADRGDAQKVSLTLSAGAHPAPTRLSTAAEVLQMLERRRDGFPGSRRAGALAPALNCTSDGGGGRI